MPDEYWILLKAIVTLSWFGKPTVHMIPIYKNMFLGYYKDDGLVKKKKRGRF